MMLRLLAEAITEHAPDEPSLVDIYLEIIKSPAHILSEFTIELVGSLIGLHWIAHLLSKGKSLVIRGVRRLLRFRLTK